MIEQATGISVPEVKFFHMTQFTIAGHSVRALRHGMAGQPASRCSARGPTARPCAPRCWRPARSFGLLPAGSRAYSSANLESAWVPSPPPAIFTGEGMQEFREWRMASRAGSLGGSLYSQDIRDYYTTPYDLGYGSIVAFDHEFPGRAALEQISQAPPRQKVTLVWNADDIARIVASQLGVGEPAKFIEWPKSRYSLFQSDIVLKDSRQVGISFDCGYIYNDRAFVSLATVENAYAEPGTEVTLLWGEAPNSTKPTVEPHVQVEVRASVAPAPYWSYARGSYRDR